MMGHPPVSCPVRITVSKRDHANRGPSNAHGLLGADDRNLTLHGGSSPMGSRFIAPADARTPRRRCPRHGWFLHRCSSPRPASSALEKALAANGEGPAPVLFWHRRATAAIGQDYGLQPRSPHRRRCNGAACGGPKPVSVNLMKPLPVVLVTPFTTGGEAGRVIAPAGAVGVGHKDTLLPVLSAVGGPMPGQA